MMMYKEKYSRKQWYKDGGKTKTDFLKKLYLPIKSQASNKTTNGPEGMWKLMYTSRDSTTLVVAQSVVWLNLRPELPITPCI